MMGASYTALYWLGCLTSQLRCQFSKGSNVGVNLTCFNKFLTHEIKQIKQVYNLYLGKHSVWNSMQAIIHFIYIFHTVQ